MKKLIFLLLVFAGFMACENESIQELPQDTSVTEGMTARENQKVDVCHKGEIINVSVNALGGHQGHGDAVDMDGDGYFDIENDCSEVDCDDSNPDLSGSPLKGVYCADFYDIQITFNDACNVTVVYDSVSCPVGDGVTWTLTSQDGNTYTYLESDPCGIDGCIVTVIVDNDNVSVGYDCWLSGSITPCN